MSMRNRFPKYQALATDSVGMALESDHAESREGLLKGDYNDEASHASPDEHYGSGSELDLDELEPLEDPSTPSMRGGWSPSKSKQKIRPSGLPSKRKGGWFRNKTLWVIATILLGGLIAVLGMLFGHDFKKPGAPLDGVSVFIL